MERGGVISVGPCVLIRPSTGWSAFFVTMEMPAAEDKSRHQLSEIFASGHSSWGGSETKSGRINLTKHMHTHIHRGERKREKVSSEVCLPVSCGD